MPYGAWKSYSVQTQKRKVGLKPDQMKGKQKGAWCKRCSLTALILSPNATASSSTRGAIIRHGPHHGAQKSTNTGTGLFNTNSSKVESVTGPAAHIEPCSGQLLRYVLTPHMAGVFMTASKRLQRTCSCLSVLCIRLNVSSGV